MSGGGRDGAPAGGTPRVDVRTDVTLTYRVGRFVSSAWLRLVHRRRVEGGEHVPERGGVLFVSNHQSFLDIPLIASATRRHVSFVARDSLRRSRFVAFLIDGSRSITIRRGRPDREALRAMVGHLRAGDCVALFPEGTRTRDGSLGPFRSGALLAARLAGTPIVPVGIRGAFEAWPRHARLPRPRRVALRFGAPIDPADPDALERARGAVGTMVGDGRFAGGGGGPGPPA